MSRTVIDVTQLLGWPGKLTGIPRVMDEIARRYALEDQTYFVAWEGNTQLFRAVRPSELQRDNFPPQTAPVTTTKSKLKNVVKKIEAASPIARRALHYPRRLLHQARRSQTSQSAEFTFEKGDRLIVLWGAWADDAYISRLQNLRANNVRLVQFAYDMLPLVTPQYSGHSTESLRRYASAIYPIASLILSISKHTAKDIADWLSQQKLKLPPVEVIRLGDDFAKAKPRKPTGETFKQAKIGKNDYILCVGTLEARKNHTLLYYVYKLALQRGIALPKLVIVGRRGWKTDDLYELMTTDPQTKDTFVLLENTGDEELAWLYPHCAFSIYPSFYEGWGLPIAESIAYGVPCVCSNTSSMPEIAGDLLTYFSPFSTDECLAAMASLLNPKNKKRAQQKLKKYSPASWDTTYQQVKKYVKDIA